MMTSLAATCSATAARPASSARQAWSSLRQSSSSFAAPLPCPAAAARSRAPRAAAARGLSVLAFRQTEQIQDWRVKQMVELAHAYLIDYLTNGKVELAEQIFADDVVHKDVVWDPTHPTVGIEGMKHYLTDLKTAFPDFWVEVDQYATVDTNSIMVSYSGSATNMGEYHHHKPTHHASNFEGTNTFKFNHDRDRITEIIVYRSAFAEDLDEVGERKMAEEGGFRELRLQRLT